MKVVVRSLQKCELRRFLVKTRELVERRSVPLLVSYCCDYPEVRDTSVVRHGVVVTKICVRSMATEEEIISGEMAGERYVRETKVIRSVL